MTQTYIDPRSLLLGVFIGFLIGMISGMVIQASAIPFNETLPGERNLGDVFTWTINNVSKRADVTYHFQIYDAKLIGKNYSYYDPDWATWEVTDAKPGCQYLAIWVRSWSEGTTTWGYSQERFNVWVFNNWTIVPEIIQMVHFEKLYRRNQYRPVVIRELENRTHFDGTVLTSERYGWRDGQELDRLEPGLSNAWDGVILYLVPETATYEDIRVCGWFGYYGTAIWYLTPRVVQQMSWERHHEEAIKTINAQRQTGLRLSDRISSSRTPA